MSRQPLLHGALTKRIIGTFYSVARELGPGHPEVFYRRAMHIALEDEGIDTQSEVPVTVHFRDRPLGGHRLDLVVAGCVVLECKTAQKIVPGHAVQLSHYLTATELQVGLVLNFGTTPTFSRVVNPCGRHFVGN